MKRGLQLPPVEERRARRAERGKARAKQGRQPTRRQLAAGAHLLQCDRQHEESTCNRNLAPKPPT